MKIVIDIPEDDYNAIRDNIKAYSLADMLFGAVQCGTVLPKGHGDLIDRNYFASRYESCGNEYCEHSDECEECNSRIVDKYDVDSAPTVIPADK